MRERKGGRDKFNRERRRERETGRDQEISSTERRRGEGRETYREAPYI